MKSNRWCVFFTKPWLVVWLIIIGFSALSYPLIIRPLSIDQGIAATIAQQILQGKLLYKDIWHLNTPGIHLTYTVGLLLFGQTASTINLWHIIWQILTIVVVFIVGRQWFGAKAGLWAAFSYAALIGTTFSVLGSAGNKESFITLPIILSLYFLKKGNLLNKGSVFNVLSGLCAGWAWYYKPVYGVILLSLITALFFYHKNRPWFLLKQALLLGGGLLLALVPLGVYLGYHHLFYEAYQQMILFASGYGLYSYKELSQPQLYFLMAINVLFFITATLPALFLFLFGSLTRNTDGDFNKHRLIIINLFIWLVVAVILQGKAFFYQWQAVLGPLVLLAGWGAVKLEQIIFKLRPRHLYFNFILAASIFIILFFSFKFYIFPCSADPLINAKDITLASQYLQNNNNCHNQKTLQLWGLWSGVYFLSGCQPATPFVYNQMFTMPVAAQALPYQQIIKERFVASLNQSPPTFVVVVLRADSLGSDPDIKSLPQLNNWLLNNYSLEKQINSLLIYRHNN